MDNLGQKIKIKIKYVENPDCQGAYAFAKGFTVNKTMSTLHLLILAIVQGLTEFLPISSSAHLILPSQILGWEDQGALIDLMAHFGSLFAVLAYFRKDVAGILTGLWELARRKLTQDSMLALNLMLATPPALLFGAALKFGGYDEAIRSPLIIACTTIIFGLLLWMADLWGKQTRTTEDLTWKGAVGLGLAQALALIPGTSRSGITMTAARAMGLTRVESARFSMLMSLPIIGAGGTFAFIELATQPANVGPVHATLSSGLIVAGLSFVVAYLTIALFMKYVPKIGMFPFMVYRLALGGALLLWIFVLN